VLQLDAAVGRWYEGEGWEEEDIEYNEFWEDYHLDVQEMKRKWQVGDIEDRTLDECVEKILERIEKGSPLPRSLFKIASGITGEVVEKTRGTSLVVLTAYVFLGVVIEVVSGVVEVAEANGAIGSFEKGIESS